MHVIPVYRPRMDHYFMAQGNLPQQLARPQTDIPTQNRISILRHPNKVIFAIPYRMTARFRRLHRRMLCIPSPKGEGFTDPRKGTLNGPQSVPEACEGTMRQFKKMHTKKAMVRISLEQLLHGKRPCTFDLQLLRFIQTIA